MKKRMDLVVLMGISLVMVSCGVSAKRNIYEPNTKLRDYNIVAVEMVSESGSISISSGSIGSLRNDQILEGNEQEKMALQLLQIELMNIGFEVVSDTAKAKAIIEFSIGSIRYDALAGWIADQAIAIFKEKSDGKIIGAFTAKGRMITATINSLISNIGEGIRKSY
jgi:hypothetical protein